MSLRLARWVSAAVMVCLAQVALAIPAVLNGMFTTNLGRVNETLLDPQTLEDSQVLADS